MIKSSVLAPVFLTASIVFYLFIPNKLLQFIALTCAFLIIFCFFYAQSLKNNIKVERNISKLKIACKEKVEINITIKNYSRFKANICYIFDDAPYLLVYKNKNSEVVTLRPHEIKKINYLLSAQERGLFQTGPIKVKTSDPLGLFSVELSIENNLQIVVRPARIKMITEPFPGLPQGSIKINNAIYEDITQRKNIRSYINGDEQRRINWRISAKQNDLFVNVYDNTYDTTFFVFLNLALEDYDLRGRYYDSEKAIEIAACIVEKARELRQRVGFAAYSKDFPYIKPAQNQYDNILDILSLIKPEEGKLNYNPVQYYKNQLPNGTIIFVIGPDEVRKYFSKVEANQENITAENIGAFRRELARA